MRTRPRRTLGAALAALTSGALILLGLAQPAAAVDLAGPFRAMQWVGTGYVYVAAGETLSLNLAGRQGSYTITRPDGTAVVQANGSTACPSRCIFSETATADGVWRLTSSVAEPWYDSVYSQVVTVLGADGTERPGRMWFDQLVGSQYRYMYNDVDLWVLSPQGSQYQATLHDLSGYGSVFQFDNLGTVKLGECVPAYVSYGGGRELPGSANESEYGLPVDCANRTVYRIFAEQPDPAMPARVDAWADGRTSATWVYPAYVAPALSEATFTPSDTATQAGTIEFTLTGQPGVVTVTLDVDGDGVPGGPLDVTLTVPAGTGANTVAWDGLDGSGAPVPVTQEVPVLLSYTGQDELHLTMSDVEGLWDGLSVRKITGPEAGSTLLSWDDSLLLTRPAGDQYPPAPLKADRVDSTGGVRGYGRPTSGLVYGWGDQRTLDTWTKSSVAVTGTGLIPARGADLEITKAVTEETVALGGLAHYTVTVTNTGTATSAPTTVTDRIVVGPERVTGIEDLTADLGAATAGADGIAWSLPALAPGATASLTYAGRVTTEASDGDRAVTNWAWLGDEPQECAPPSCGWARVIIPAGGGPTDPEETTTTPSSTGSTTPGETDTTTPGETDTTTPGETGTTTPGETGTTTPGETGTTTPGETDTTTPGETDTTTPGETGTTTPGETDTTTPGETDTTTPGETGTTTPGETDTTTPGETDTTTPGETDTTTPGETDTTTPGETDTTTPGETDTTTPGETDTTTPGETDTTTPGETDTTGPTETGTTATPTESGTTAAPGTSGSTPGGTGSTPGGPGTTPGALPSTGIEPGTAGLLAALLSLAGAAIVLVHRRRTAQR